MDDLSLRQRNVFRANKTLERTGAPRYSFVRMEYSTLDRQSLSALPAPVAQLGR